MVKLGGFIEKLGKGGWRRLVLIAGIAAIVLLFLSTLTPQSEPQTVQQYTAEETAKLERELERRLTELLAEIDGVSSPRVMVTLDRTIEHVYAEESKVRSGSGENSTESTLALSGSGKEALETSVILPKVRGVAVVCGGAEDIVIREKVVNTAARVLDIKVSQVYVTS